MASVAHPGTGGALPLSHLEGRNWGTWRERNDLRGSNGEAHGTTRAQDGLCPGLEGVRVGSF